MGERWIYYLHTRGRRLLLRAGPTRSRLLLRTGPTGNMLRNRLLRTLAQLRACKILRRAFPESVCTMIEAVMVRVRIARGAVRGRRTRLTRRASFHGRARRAIHHGGRRRTGLARRTNVLGRRHTVRVAVFRLQRPVRAAAARNAAHRAPSIAARSAANSSLLSQFSNRHF